MKGAPPTSQPPLTLEQRLRIAHALAQYPALTLAVIMRRDIGYRVLSPLDLSVVTAVILLICGVVNAEHRPQDLMAFAFLTLALGLFQRFLRWTEFKQGEQQHSKYIGTSPFEFSFMPQFLLRDRRLGRFADPVVALLAGIALLRVSPALGTWICFAALCLRLEEFCVYRNHIHETLDIVDGMSKSQFHSGTVDRFSDSGGNPTAETNEEGIPTGLGADIQKKTKKGQTTQPKPAKPKVEVGLLHLISAKPKLTRANVILAFLVAILADGLYFLAHYILGRLSGWGWTAQLFSGADSFSRIVEFGVNCIAMTATMILLGFHWALVPSIFMPFVPGKFPIPTWTGCVAFVIWQRRKDLTPVETETEPEPQQEAMPQDRMQRLKEYHRQGLITDAEFEEKRRKILDEL